MLHSSLSGEVSALCNILCCMCRENFRATVLITWTANFGVKYNLVLEIKRKKYGPKSRKYTNRNNFDEEKSVCYLLRTPKHYCSEVWILQELQWENATFFLKICRKMSVFFRLIIAFSGSQHTWEYLRYSDQLILCNTCMHDCHSQQRIKSKLQTVLLFFFIFGVI